MIKGVIDGKGSIVLNIIIDGNIDCVRVMYLDAMCRIFQNTGKLTAINYS